VLDLGAELGIVEKRGSFYLYKDERLTQGRENLKQHLRENPGLCYEIENAIRRETGLPELTGMLPYEVEQTVQKAEERVRPTGKRSPSVMAEALEGELAEMEVVAEAVDAETPDDDMSASEEE
jgi:hypothetical protein